MFWFGWVGFYAISTIEGYLIQDYCLYIYIKYIGFVDTFLNERNLIFLLTVKWFQVLLSIANNSIKQSFVYTQLHDQTVLFLRVHFSLSHLFPHSLNVIDGTFTHDIQKHWIVWWLSQSFGSAICGRWFDLQ